MKIAFIQTGGTIDKDYPHFIKGWAFEIGDPAVQRILEKIQPEFEYEVLTAFRKDSMEITEDDRAVLRDRVSQLESDRVVITHGTDTLVETAQALASIPNKTIVLTGAMRPQQFSNSDADFNLGMAIGTVQTNAPGVYICIQGLVLRPNNAARNTKTGEFYVKETASS